jgi:WD40 repeat protein
LILSADEKHLYSASDDKTVRKWDLESLKEIFVLKKHRRGVTSLAISTD